MKLYEVTYPRLESQKRDELRRELMSQGWEVWTDFELEREGGRVVKFDVLARRGDEVRVIELVRTKRSKSTDLQIDKYRAIAEGNGWDFQLVEVKDPTTLKGSVSAERERLQVTLDQLVDAFRQQSDPVVKRAISTQAFISASHLVELILQGTSAADSYTSVIEAARRLVNKGVISDGAFERITRLQQTRNRLVHNDPVLLSEADIRDALEVVKDLGRSIPR